MVIMVVLNFMENYDIWSHNLVLMIDLLKIGCNEVKTPKETSLSLFLYVYLTLVKMYLNP